MLLPASTEAITALVDQIGDDLSDAASNAKGRYGKFAASVHTELDEQPNSTAHFMHNASLHNAYAKPKKSLTALEASGKKSKNRPIHLWTPSR